MGDIYNRGTKDTPRWFMRFVDADGKRKNRPTDATTKAQALRILGEVQARVARGEAG